MKTLQYPRYKDSENEWMGKIPDGWHVKKLKHISNVRISNVDKKSRENEPAVSLCNYLHVYKNEFITAKMNFMKATATEEQIRKLSLHRNDVLITKDSEEPDDIAVPALVTEDLKGVVCGYHLALITPNSDVITGDYLFRSLQSKKINDQFIVEANGVTRFGISTYPILNSFFILPSISEQKQIAHFLNAQTSRIDKAIKTDENLIELLKEKRISLINYLVTKGLNPETELKNSGIEWIGKMPIGWETKKLKYVADLKSGKNITSEQIDNEGAYPVYGGNGLRGFFSNYTHNGNFILIGRQGALCGNINYANGKFWASEHAVVVTLEKGNNIIYVGEVLRTMNLNRYSQSAAQPGLAVEEIAALHIPVPPYEEQNKIAEYISVQTSKIDETVKKIQERIGLLNEFRKSLISSAVTGKIDVRKQNGLGSKIFS